ncbi:MAG TPA: MIP family channel protein [Pirellulales bacterium]|jgi:glycerol uptake facilitator protein|nr:MIP family channel protein [Pirellulales bacterium]
MSRELLREVAAEFLGTLTLIAFGVGVVAQVVLGEGKTGEYLSINLGWGLAVTMGAYVAGGISGAHLNPAVTLALALHRGFPWSKVLPYWAAQFAGAFVASALVYATYCEAIDHVEPTARTLVTAGIWSTYPQDYLSNFPGGFVDQVVGTALLMLVIFAVTDERNMALPPSLSPIVVGLAVLVIGMTYGLNAGYAINPARDLGPRVFTWLAGWGTQVFTAHDSWWWVPVVGPLCGAVVGGFLYDLLITRLHVRTRI